VQDHSYFKQEPYNLLNYELNKLEIEALKWTAEEKMSIIKEKDRTIKNLRRTLSKLTQKYNDLELRLTSDANRIDEKSKALLENVKARLTPGQIQLLSNENLEKITWDDEDKAKAIALWAASTKGYSFMRDVIHIPLPSPRTIYRWLQGVPVYPDQMLRPVMNLLKAKLEDQTPMQCICSIALDEMAIDPSYCYDQNQDRIYGGAKNVTVVTARGLFYNWKQVIYFTFDSTITAKTIKCIIMELHKVNAKVVSITSDMGTKNQGLWKELHIGRVQEGD